MQKCSDENCKLIEVILSDRNIKAISCYVTLKHKIYAQTLRDYLMFVMSLDTYSFSRIISCYSVVVQNSPNCRDISGIWQFILQTEVVLIT